MRTTPLENAGWEAQRAIGAAVVGNVLEWYDFAVYGYLATAIAREFFPGQDSLTALLSTFGAFGLGFVVRPLGGFVIGRMGDLKGRKAALLLTLFLMAFGTAGIGLIPGAASIGVWAPMLLVALRLTQGFSAGGEWAGSTAFIVEWAPGGRRGYFGSFQQAAVGGGLLLGSAVAALLSTVLQPGQMDRWGWRIPFLLGGLLGPVGLYMRRHVGETPAFLEARRAVQPPDLARHVRLAAKAFGFTILWTVSYYTMLTYMPTFTQRFAGLTPAEALWSNTIGLVVMVASVPLMGDLSDRLGRKPLLLAACAAFVVLPYPLFRVLVGGAPFAVAVAIQAAFGVMIALFSGPGPAAIAEIFPTGSRSTWMSAGYTLAVTVFGGFAPYIATALIAATGSPVAPAWYLIAAAVTSTIVIACLPETVHETLQ